MGNRAQIKIREGNEQVTLYTHWDADTILDTLRAALLRAEQGKRLDDAPYLARIIFCQMVPETEWYTATGYGIWTGELDGRCIEIDVKNQVIVSRDYGIALQSLKEFIYNEGDSENDDEDGDEASED